MSAAAEARGGTLAAAAGDPLDAVQGNPAGLGSLHTRVLDVSGVGTLVYGLFTDKQQRTGSLAHSAGALPFGAVGMPVGRSQWKAALALTPDMLLHARWRYVDPAGTAGVTYGLQTNESEIVALRPSGTLARSLGDRLAIGVSLGAVYNANTLASPYIFQQQPALAGLKVLLRLHTTGWGANGGAGVQWQPRSTVRLGAAWRSGTSVVSRGTASGSASALFAKLGIANDPAYSYRARVENHLPMTAAAGLVWQAGRSLRLGLEVGYTGWASAFRQLPVRLTGGTNAVINSVAGSPDLTDAIPLHWRDQGSLRTGIELPVAERWTLRAGYGWQSNPVPHATLMPMTAAIFQHSLAAGAGWSKGHCHGDIAYQAQLPASDMATGSSLRAGEYEGSRVRVGTHSITLTGRVSF